MSNNQNKGVSTFLESQNACLLQALDLFNREDPASMYELEKLFENLATELESSNQTRDEIRKKGGHINSH